ncbi:hypothetical protein [Enterococcus sp. AZ192]|uniref:hypothetical protein n=1 Tax=unclassified Enterococcus TaxID=2608891 RepID=UPI003D2E3122
MELNESQAMQAMIIFLDQYYEQVQSDDIAVLLGSLTLLEDGKPVDSAMWDEWLESIKKVKS